MKEKNVVGFVGAHMDDIELACSGTVQRVIGRSVLRSHSMGWEVISQLF